jgi:hypothetical protein
MSQKIVETFSFFPVGLWVEKERYSYNATLNFGIKKPPINF